jgi:Ca2+-binding RTX toxin-like protein
VRAGILLASHTEMSVKQIAELYDTDESQAIDLRTKTAEGSHGNDTLVGFEGVADVEGVYGSHFDDTFTGTRFDNRFIGNGGGDTFVASLGNDLLNGEDHVSGDRVLFSSIDPPGGVTVDLETNTASWGGAHPSTQRLSLVENITRSANADLIAGDQGDNGLAGGGGPDELMAGAGNDSIRGGAGSDELRAGAGRDVVHAASGRDRIFGADGSDELLGKRHRDDIHGGGGRDTLAGGPGNDFLNGGPGADSCRAGAGGARKHSC